MIYFDHAASTHIVESSLKIFTESLVEDFANPSAAHKLGKTSMKRVDKARVKILKLLKAKLNDQLIFLSSATEANNLIIKGLRTDLDSKVHYSLGDHPSTVEPVKSLKVEKVSIPLLEGGAVDEQAFLSSLSTKSRLVVFCHVNNQSGAFHNIVSLAKKAKELVPNIHIHIDGVQALGKVDVNLSKVIDSYTISGHKLGAPKGIGALFIRSGVDFDPQLHGGGHEFGLRSSTVNTPAILALSEAISIGVEEREKSLLKVNEVNAYLREQLNIFNLGIKFPFPLDQTSPYILCFILPNISSDIVVRHLEMKNIYVSSSSACSSKAKGYSASFDAMRIKENDHKSVLRVSFSKDSTIEEAKIFSEELTKVITEIKKI